MTGVGPEAVFAFRWRGVPSHERIRAFAEGLTAGLADRIAARAPLFIMIEGDAAQTLAMVLRDELNVACEMMVIDGIVLRDFDYVDIGEREGWTTNHCAAVAVVTPYENQLILMHEGASGGGKSEMTEHIHRMEDGRLLLGDNIVTHEQRTLNLIASENLAPLAVLDGK